MAAELSYKNGAAELLYVGETPWHREGFKFDRAPSWSELMAVVDYDLEKRPYWYPAAVEGGTEMRESDEAFYVARKDNSAAWASSARSTNRFRTATPSRSCGR